MSFTVRTNSKRTIKRFTVRTDSNNKNKLIQITTISRFTVKNKLNIIRLNKRIINSTISLKIFSNRNTSIKCSTSRSWIHISIIIGKTKHRTQLHITGSINNTSKHTTIIRNISNIITHFGIPMRRTQFQRS